MNKCEEGFEGGAFRVPRGVHRVILCIRAADTVCTAVRLESYCGFVPACDAVPDVVVGCVGVGGVGGVEIGDCSRGIRVCEGVSYDVSAYGACREREVNQL